jgi:hypothetical protein
MPKKLSPVEKAKIALSVDKTATMFCCCVCQCESRETKDMKCCFIFPINCGVQLVALAVILIAVCQFLEVFYQLLNDKIDWWYVLVGVILAVPLIIALASAVGFFADETDSSRTMLQAGLILVIISITLSAIWNASYFWWFYKSDEVVTGNDGIGFLKVTRKQEIVFSIFIATVVDAFAAYFLCVLGEYKEAFRRTAIQDWLKANPDEESQPLKNEDSADKKEDDKKDEAADGDDKKEGGD